MNILPIGTTNTNSVAEPKKVEQAAREFESLLISEMLRSSRESASSGLGDQESDSEESTMQDMADQPETVGLVRLPGFVTNQAGDDPGDAKHGQQEQAVAVAYRGAAGTGGCGWIHEMSEPAQTSTNTAFQARMSPCTLGLPGQ